MQQILAEQSIQLSCLSASRVIDTLDIDCLVDELAGGTPPAFLTPERLCEQDLVVVATEVGSGRYLGLLGARADVANGQRFLRLDMACVAPMARGRRLISALLARAAAERKDTAVLAARTGTPSWFRALRHFAASLDAAAFHPAPAGAVVALRTAAMARQIAGALYPEHRFDVATGMLHGKWVMPARVLQRHASAEAWCAARDASPFIPERLLAVIDLRGVNRRTLLALARRYATTA